MIIWRIFKFCIPGTDGLRFNRDLLDELFVDGFHSSLYESFHGILGFVVFDKLKPPSSETCFYLLSPFWFVPLKLLELGPFWRGLTANDSIAVAVMLNIIIINFLTIFDEHDGSISIMIAVSVVAE